MTLDELDALFTQMTARYSQPLSVIIRALAISPADLDTIAALVSAIPFLLAEIRAARALVAWMRFDQMSIHGASLLDTYDAARAATEAGGSDAT